MKLLINYKFNLTNTHHSSLCFNKSQSFRSYGNIVNSYLQYLGDSLHINIPKETFYEINAIISCYGLEYKHITSNYQLCDAILFILTSDSYIKTDNLILEILDLVLENSIDKDEEHIECQHELESEATLGKIIKLHNYVNCSTLELIFNSCIQYYMNAMGGKANLGTTITLFIKKVKADTDNELTDNELVS